MSQESFSPTNVGTSNSAKLPSQSIDTPLCHDLQRASTQIGKLNAALDQFSEIERELAESRAVVSDTHKIKDTLEQAESAVRRLQQAHDQLKAEHASATSQAAENEAALKSENSRLSAELQQAEAVYLQISTECEELKAALAVSRSETTELRDMHDAFRMENANVQSQLHSDLEQTQTSLMREQEGRGVSEKELDAARLRISHLQARLEDLNTATEQTTQRSDDQTAQLQTQISELTHQLATLQAQRSESSTSSVVNDQLELERDEFRLQVVALQTQIERLRSETPMSDSQSEHRKQTREMQYQIKQLEADLRETTHQLEISQLKMGELQRNTPHADTQQSVYVDALMQDAKALCDAAKQREEAALEMAGRLEAEIVDLRFELASMKRASGSRGSEPQRMEVRQDAGAGTQYTVHAHEFQQREKRRKIHDAKQAGQNQG